MKERPPSSLSRFDAIAASRAGCTLFLGLVVAGCGRPILSADDARVAPGKKAKLVAYVEREAPLGLRKDIEDVAVTFSVEGQEVGRAKTNDKGRASVQCRLPSPDVSCFTARAVVDGQDLETAGRVFSWQEDRVIIAVDIDGTVSDTEYKDLILKKEDDESDPIKASRKVLTQLAADYHIMYFTARPRFLMDKTRLWLEEHQYPPGPIVMAPSIRKAIHPSGYKHRTLAGIREDWPNLLIGIGNKRGDAEAYGANEMLALIVSQADDQSFGRHAISFPDWKSLDRFLQANRAVLTDPEKLKKAVRGETLLLQPVQTWRGN
jgi:hypothetical protein